MASRRPATLNANTNSKIRNGSPNRLKSFGLPDIFVPVPLNQSISKKISVINLV